MALGRGGEGMPPGAMAGGPRGGARGGGGGGGGAGGEGACEGETGQRKPPVRSRTQRGRLETGTPGRRRPRLPGNLRLRIGLVKPPLPAPARPALLPGAG